MSYSIAIPAYNEEAQIGGLLRHLLDAAPPGLVEIVVGDSLSTDATTVEVHEVMQSDARVRLVTAAAPGKPAVWNTLIEAVATDTVVFFDADAIPGPHCIERLLTALLEPRHLPSNGATKSHVGPVRIAVGGRRVARRGAPDARSRLARFLADPVVETCLTGPAYAVRRDALRKRMADEGFDEMPNVFAEDIWLLGLLRPDEFVVVDDATVELDLDELANQRLTSARRGLVRHEVKTSDPAIRYGVLSRHPQALLPMAQARHVLHGDYSKRRKARWFAAGVAKTVADVVHPVRSTTEQLIAQYDASPSSLLRGPASTSGRLVDHSQVEIRPATCEDASVYAVFENIAAGGATKRLYGAEWPLAIESLFRKGVDRHGMAGVLIAEAGGQVVGTVAVVPHELNGDTTTSRRSTVVRKARALRGQPAGPTTVAGEVYVAALAVDPNARRLGVAQQLLRAAVEHPHAVGVSAIVADVAPGNEASLGAFRSAGFEPMRRTSGASIVVLSKPLTAAADHQLTLHQQFHDDGFVHNTGSLSSGLAELGPQLLADAETFDRAVADRGDREEVPYFFSSAIEAVARDAAIVKVVRSILRTDDLVVWGPNIRRDTPNDAHRWHIDLESWYWPSVTVAMGLSGCTSESATWFLPGTARLTVMPDPTATDAQAMALAASKGVHAEPRQWDGLANGRFGVFDAKTWHRGDLAASAGRTMLFLHYQSADAPRVPTMVDHGKHVWSRSAAPFLPLGPSANPLVARTPAREQARRLDHLIRDLVQSSRLTT